MKRSGSLGFLDLKDRSGVYHYPNMRASCWVNMIPACGLVLVPEGSSSCPCAYNYKTSIAFMPAERHNHWGMYGGNSVKKAPVRDLRLNFGAPGDKPGEDESIWFAFPRPSTTGPRGAGGMASQRITPLPVEVVSGEADVVARNPDWHDMPADDIPWVQSCGVAGPLKLKIQFAPKGSKPRRYRLSVHVCRSEGKLASGPFDLKANGKKVISGDTNVIETAAIQAADTLTLEVVPRGDKPPVIGGLHLTAAE